MPCPSAVDGVLDEGNQAVFGAEIVHQFYGTLRMFVMNFVHSPAQRDFSTCRKHQLFCCPNTQIVTQNNYTTNGQELDVFLCVPCTFFAYFAVKKRGFNRKGAQSSSKGKARQLYFLCPFFHFFPSVHTSFTHPPFMIQFGHAKPGCL